MKFYYKPFERKKYWSNRSHKYYTSKSISDQVWDSPGNPCKGESLDIHSIIKKLPVTNSKDERSAIMRFDTDIFPLKEYVGYDKWNGIIFIDLDMVNSKLLCEKIDAVVEDKKVKVYNADKNTKFFNALIDILSNIAPNNFYMIEHSSSRIGLHILFYFDIEKTEDNFFKCAEYCIDLLKNRIHNNDYGVIQDFDKMISEPKVIDGIYNRIYQKCFITGIDAYINDFVSGNIDNKTLDRFVIDRKDPEPIEANYKVTNKLDHIKDNIFDVDHNQRFYIYTALKKVTKDKNECNGLYAELCKKFKLYKNYTYQSFLREFNYDDIDETKGRVRILEKYGFNIDTGEIYYHLNEKQYLGDIRADILDNVSVGINFLQAPTGSGKTVCWTDLNLEIISDFLEISNKKSLLIVEPLNSIINTKYDDRVITVTGSKQFPKYFTSYAMYVTNYNKLLRKTQDGYILRPDIIEFFSNFEYIIIDESHIIIKDAFRCDVLIPFVKSLVEAAKTSKIILQTASPMDEDLIFNIKNKIIVTKQPKAEIKFITRYVDNDKFCIQDLTDITKYYLSQGRKVYIYWNNASLTQLHSFKSTYDEPDKVAIYHKRNTGEESMERISKYHLLESDDIERYKYDILLSSVYFGVGNDLNDRCKAAVLIVGDNTVQEDIQAIGRWRNSTDIEVCQVVLKNEYEFIKQTKDTELNRKLLLAEERQKLEKLWHDKLCKDKSILIFNKTWEIKNYEDIEILAVMKSAETYYSAYSTKIKILEDPYYNIRCKHDIDRPLEVNTELNEKTKTYWDNVKEIRNIQKRNILSGNCDYNEINKDTNIEKFYHLWNKLKIYDIGKIIDPKYICSTSNYNKLNIWVKYYRQLIANEIDYPELYSLLWYVKQDKADSKELIKIFDKEIEESEYYCILAYIIFIHNKNKNVKDYRIIFNFFKTFKWYCKLFSQLPNELIDMFYGIERTDNEPTKAFFDEVEWKDDDFESIVINTLNDIGEQIEKINKTQQEIYRLIKKCLFIINEKKAENGAIGGTKSSPKKSVVVTESFKRPEKYKLSIGQKFESCTEMAVYTGVSNKTVSQWMTKKWIA